MRHSAQWQSIVMLSVIYAGCSCPFMLTVPLLSVIAPSKIFSLIDEYEPSGKITAIFQMSRLRFLRQLYITGHRLFEFLISLEGATEKVYMFLIRVSQN
jgi:hypothetical protein